MRTVGIFEAKTKLSELIDAVERGEEIRITRRGRPVARLVVDNVANQSPPDSGARERLDRLHRGLRNSGRNFSIGELIDWKNEGRR